jgi:hypothetical protein
MVTKFPKFSQALAQDPATRRIWYGIATAHDFESHDNMTEENLYQKIFASHFGHLAIIFLWTSGNLFHVAWQGNFEQWVLNPLKVKPNCSRYLGSTLWPTSNKSIFCESRRFLPCKHRLFWGLPLVVYNWNAN